MTLKTQPAPPTLSAHAMNALLDLAYSPAPRQAFNPGVVGRLQRDELIEIVELPSPYPAQIGQRIEFARITEKGRKAVNVTPQPDARRN